jgi:hypothetical protein
MIEAVQAAISAEHAGDPVQSPIKPTTTEKLAADEGTADIFRDDLYPKDMGEDAYHGLAGRFIRLVEPHTEADPNWMLVLFLTYAGNIFGRNAWIRRDGDHTPNLFSCAVGSTSGGRKGTAFFPIDMFFRPTDEGWFKSIQSGLSSGEGLIWCVRDPITKREKVKNTGYQDSIVDPGIEDKRLLVRQPEFAGALQAMRRQGNNLSAIIRDAWDRSYLNTMTKNSQARATGAHISIAANIPPAELRRRLLAEEVDNGFANRFLWCCSRLSKYLPQGGGIDLEHNESICNLREEFKSRKDSVFHGEVRFDHEAQALWGFNDRPRDGLYYELAKAKPGFFGELTARSPQQVLRLSLIYALLDGAQQVGRLHLMAGLEVWRYCEQSCLCIFGDSVNDQTADTILNALRKAGANGMTRSEIIRLFQGNKKAEDIQRALQVLITLNRGRSESRYTEASSKPSEHWFYVRT